jgi:hypothetical protein
MNSLTNGWDLGKSIVACMHTGTGPDFVRKEDVINRKGKRSVARTIA